MNDVCIMLKPASSLCNLRCKYCFYTDVVNMREKGSLGVMTEKTADKILENVFSDLNAGDHITFAFQGGEPTIAGLEFFRHFVQVAELCRGKVRVDYALQTNGMFLDEEWCIFLKKYNFLVGLSMDGMEETHNLYRVDTKGRGSYDKVMASKQLLDQYQIAYNVLMTLTNLLARYPRRVWQFIKENGIKYVQFTPCLGSLENKKGDQGYALTPIRFAKFYKQMLDLWMSDWEKGIYTSIKLFDDLVNLLAFGEETACGITGRCLPQIVVEADGSVYPCDFYMLDGYRAGNLCRQSLFTLLEIPVMSEFRYRAKENDLCLFCKYLEICGGGCRRMREAVCYTKKETYCGYRDFLDSALGDLGRIAEENRRRVF